MLKKAYKTGMLAYALMLVLALVYYWERTVFLDIAYQLFYIIKDGVPTIQNYRFGAVLTQVLPLISVKLGLPLKGIMAVYSVAFIVYYFICYVVCGSVFKNERIALTLLLFNILFITHTFFWTQSELPQGVAFMFVFLAFITRGDKKVKPTIPNLLIAATAIGTIVFFHPLMLFCFLYALLFIALTKDMRPPVWVLLSAVLLYAAAAFVKGVFFKTAYDASAMEGAMMLVHIFPDYFMLWVHKAFLLSCIDKYYWLPLGYMAMVIYYCYKRQWVKLGMLSLFSIGYIIMVNVTYMHKYPPAFYMENLYLPMAVFLAFPLVYDLFPVLEKKKILVLCILLISATFLFRTVQNSKMYTARLNWERKYLAENIDKKLIVDAQLLPIDTLLQTWGSCYEFWLLSTTGNGKTASIVFSDKWDAMILPAFNRLDFITNWELVPYTELKPPYFIMDDTMSRYTIIKK